MYVSRQYVVNVDAIVGIWPADLPTGLSATIPTAGEAMAGFIVNRFSGEVTPTPCDPDDSSQNRETPAEKASHRLTRLLPSSTKHRPERRQSIPIRLDGLYSSDDKMLMIVARDRIGDPLAVIDCNFCATPTKSGRKMMVFGYSVPNSNRLRNVRANSPCNRAST